MKELDTVVLRRRVPGTGLEAGDVGAIVHCHHADAFDVEFVTARGETVALLTLGGADVRPAAGKEILHVRSLESNAQD